MVILSLDPGKTGVAWKGPKWSTTNLGGRISLEGGSLFGIGVCFGPFLGILEMNLTYDTRDASILGSQRGVWPG